VNRNFCIGFPDRLQPPLPVTFILRKSGSSIGKWRYKLFYSIYQAFTISRWRSCVCRCNCSIIFFVLKFVIDEMRYFLFRLHWIARLSDLQRGSFSGRSLKLCPTENWIICFIVKIVKRPVIKYTYKRVISILFPFQYADLGQLESWNWNFFKGMLDPERSLRSYGPGCYLGNPMWRHLWSFHSRSADIFIHCFFSYIVDREVAMRSNQRLFMHLLSKPPRPRCIITEIKACCHIVHIRIHSGHTHAYVYVACM